MAGAEALFSKGIKSTQIVMILRIWGFAIASQNS
jgi:hypothetical protein